MSWKRILVHIKSYRDCTPAIDEAIQIAKPLGAHLTGLYTMRELAMLKLMFGPDLGCVRTLLRGFGGIQSSG
jgi:hypothetical protein